MMRLVLLALLAAPIASIKLIDDMVDFYSQILKANNMDRFDAKGLKAIMQAFDSDSVCSGACESYLNSLLPDPSGWDYPAFRKLIYSLYGDYISDDPFQPQEVHLALTNQVSSMKVMWATGQNLLDPYVEYKLASNDDWKLAKRATAVNFTYTVEQKWWPIFHGVLYDADMTGLEADTKYAYRVSGYDQVNQTQRYSSEFEFKSAPVINADRKTVVSVFADHGTIQILGFSTIEKLFKVQIDIDLDYIFVAGDLSYAGLDTAFPHLNITNGDELECMWDLLFVQNEPLAARYPWMVGPGNHEAFYNWTAFTSRYHMPQSTGSVGNFWYDYSYGNIHWVSISSEHDLSDGSPQKLWLADALARAAANRKNVPWIVLSLHKPLYCSDADSPLSTTFAANLDDLCLQYDVDLVVAGHWHCYERVHPVTHGVVNVYPTKVGRVGSREDYYYSTGKGPVHVTQGNSGAMQVEKWHQPQPDWSAVRYANGVSPRNKTSTDGVSMEMEVDVVPGPEGKVTYIDTFGFGVITALNSTHLHYESHANTNNTKFTDSFWIVKRV